MKKSLLISTAAVMALGAGVAWGQDIGASSYEAGVSLLLPEATGFMYSAQVDALGLGSGTSSISVLDSYFTLTGFASSTGADMAAGENASAFAGSGVYSDFGFDRTVATNAASSGVGRVVASGDAIGSVGGVGSAMGSTSQQSIIYDADLAADIITESSAATESAASLVGSASTSLIAGVVGTQDTFVGETGTEVSDSQFGAAVAGLTTAGDGTTINISSTLFPEDYSDLLFADGEGVAGITGQWASNGLDLSVANAGGGTVSLGAETGGFFTGGVSTLGSGSFNQTFSAY